MRTVVIAFFGCLVLGALGIAIGWNARITYEEWLEMRDDEESAPVTATERKERP